MPVRCSHRPLVITFAVLLGGAGVGCNPTCSETCTKLLSCESLVPITLTKNQCKTQCDREINLYKSWEDQDKIDRFNLHKECISQSTCAQIADGDCYDGVTFPY